MPGKGEILQRLVYLSIKLKSTQVFKKIQQSEFGDANLFVNNQLDPQLFGSRWRFTCAVKVRTCFHWKALLIFLHETTTQRKHFGSTERSSGWFRDEVISISLWLKVDHEYHKEFEDTKDNVRTSKVVLKIWIMDPFYSIFSYTVPHQIKFRKLPLHVCLQNENYII